MFLVSGAPPRAPRSSAALRLVCAALLMVLGDANGLARAQQSTAATSLTQSFEIPDQDLISALLKFSEVSGIQLFFDSTLAEGRRSNALSGEMSVDRALQHLLQGTGLSYRRTNAGTITIEPAPKTGDSALLLDRVMVEAGDSPTEVSDDDRAYKTAGSSTYISQEKIERFRGTSVGDIFQGTPGVLIGENRNSGGLDVNIRGMQGQGRVPILVDGARQETTVYRGYAGVASRSYVDPDLIGGINIEKGPSMSAQGTGAVGGLVNMRTIGANDIIRDDDKDWGVRIRGSAIGNNTGSRIPLDTQSGYAVGGSIFEQGQAYRINCQYDCSNDNPLPDPIAATEGLDRPGLLDFKGWAGSIAAAKRFEHVDVVAAYAQRRQGNYYAGKNGPSASIDLSEQVNRGFWTDVYPKLVGASRFRAGERIANTEFESRSVLLKSNFFLPRDQNLELGFIRYDSEYGELMPSALIRFGLVLQAPSSTVGANTYTARYSFKPENSRWFDLKANLWHTDTRSRNVNYPDALVELIPNLELGLATERYERWGADISNTMTFQFFGELQWRYGAALQLEDVKPLGSDDEDAVTFMRDGDRDEVSVFTAVQWKPLASLTFDAGIRYSDFSAHDRSPVLIPEEGSPDCADRDGDGACDPISVHDTASRGAAPMASLTWEPWKGLQFFALYSEALRMPSLFESTRGFSVTQAFDVAIKPEHAYNREYGINLLRDGVLFDRDKLRLKTAYFHNTVRDYLTRTSPNLWEESAYTAQISQIFTLRNIKKASFNGFELSAEYDAGLVFANIGGTRYTHIETCHYGSYRREECTHYGVANSYINNMIPPKWHASATLGTRLFGMRWTLGARATFMGQRTRQPEYEDDTQRGYNLVIPWHQYTLVDLFTRYRFSERLSAEFNVDNLTDRYYLDALGLGLVPSPGRSARASLTLQF